jgi:hypothetical protein
MRRGEVDMRRGEVDMRRGEVDMPREGWWDLKLCAALGGLAVNLPRSCANECEVRRNKAGGDPEGERYGGT